MKANTSPRRATTGKTKDDTPRKKTRGGAQKQPAVQSKKRVERAGKDSRAPSHKLAERKHLEEALRESQSKFQDLVERLPQVIYTSEIGVNGAWEYVSPQIEGLLGFTPVEWMADSSNWERHVHPDDLPRQEKLEEDALKRGKTFEGEYRMFRRDGREIWVRDSGHIHPAERGKPPIVQGLLTDITERKRIEQELQSAQARFRGLVEQIPAITYTAKLDEARTRLYVSPQIESFLGVPQAEYLADASLWQKMLHPDDRERVLAAARRFYETEKPFVEDYRSVARDGRVLWFHDEAVIIADDLGQERFIQGVKMDITERKQAEEVLRQQSQDIVLINRLNQTINEGSNLNNFMQILSDEFTRLFSSSSSNIFLLDTEKQHLTIQSLYMRSRVIKQIERMIGISIPPISLGVASVSFYDQAIREKTSLLCNDPQAIQEMIVEYAAQIPLPEVIRRTIKKIIPKIHKLLGYQGIIIVPLLVSDKPVGLLEVTKNTSFSGEDLRRIETIAGQLTSAILSKQVEEKLRESKQRFQALVEHGADQISLLGADGALLYENPSAARPLGFPAGAFLGRNLFELVHPDDAERASQTWAEVLNQPGVSLPSAFRLRHADRSWRWMEGTATNLLDEPAVQAIVINYRDVTERKRMEESVQESEERYRLLFDANPQPMWVYDLETLEFLAVNEAAMAHYGYSKKEFQRMTILDLRPPEEIPALIENLTREPHNLEWSGPWKQRKKDGALMDVDVLSHNFLFAERPARLVLANDITERKQAEEKLRASEERYRSLVEGMLDGVYRSTHDGKFMDVNPAMLKMFGYDSREQMLALDIKQDLYFTAEERESLFLDTGQEKVDEFRMKRRDGSEIWVEDHGRYVHDAQGNVIYHEGTLRDITERKQAQEKVRASEENYRDLYENNPLMLFTLDTHGTTVAINQTAVAQLEYDRAELIGESVLKVFHPDEHQNVLTTFRKFVETQIQSAPWEFRKVTKSGKIIWVSETARLVLGKDGNNTVLISCEDITARKQAEEKVQRQNQRLKVLREIDTAILAADSIESVVGVALEHIRELIECRRATLALYDQEANEAVIFDVRTLGETSIPQGMRVPLGVFQNMLQTLLQKQPVLINDLSLLPDPPDLFKTLAKEGLRSSCILPFFSKDTLIGTFNLSSELPGFFDDEKIELGREVANQMAIAITQTRLNEALRESQSRLSLFFNQALDGFFFSMLDEPREWSDAIDKEEALDYVLKHQHITEVNDAMIQQYGATRETFIGRTASDFFAHDLGQARAFRRALFDQGHIHLETEERKDDGVPISVEGDYVCIYDEQGRIRGMFGIQRDVTERRQAQEMLRASEERYRNIFDTVPVSIWEQDFSQVKHYLDELKADGVEDMRSYFTAHPEELSKVIGMVRILDVNDRTLELFEAQSKDELLGSLDKVFVRESRPVFREELITLAQGQSGFKADVSLQTLLGAPVSVVLKISFPADGALFDHVLVSMTDITERKAAEQALLQFRSVMDESHDAIYMINPQSGHYVDFNRQAYASLGYTADELWRMRVTEIAQHIPNLDLWRERVELVRENNGLTFETAYLHKKGTVFPVEVSARMLEYDGREIMVAIVRDITERTQADQQIRAHIQRLNSLHTVNSVINASFDLKVINDVLLEQAIHQLHVDAADILLFNPDSLTLHYSAGRGFQSYVNTDADVRLGDGLAGRAALERKSLYINRSAELQLPEDFESLWQREGFQSYAGIPLVAKGQVTGVLELYLRQSSELDSSLKDFLETLAGQAAIAINNAQLFERLQRSNVDLSLAYDATIVGWSRALDLRDHDTEGHTQRVTNLTLELARQMDIPSADIVHIYRGALLHDIGKMGIPDSILLKPGSLSDEEFAAMRKHPDYAFDMLSPIEYLRPALDIPYCHHEKWDGTGYPRQLYGVEIPLAARIFAVVDVWDALCSDRPYRAGWLERDVEEYIRAQSGQYFDPEIADAFLKMIQSRRDRNVSTR